MGKITTALWSESGKEDWGFVLRQKFTEWACTKNVPYSRGSAGLILLLLLFSCGLNACNCQQLVALERLAVRLCDRVSKYESAGLLFALLRIRPLRERWLLKILATAFLAIREFRS